MNLYLRLLATLLRSWIEPRMSTRAACEQWFRVWPRRRDIISATFGRATHVGQDRSK